MTPKDTEQHKVRHVTVGDDSDGQRIDNFLNKTLKGAPKSYIYRILRKGEVRVDKKRAKPDFRLSAGQTVRIPPIRLPVKGEEAPVSKQIQTRIEASILYENEQLIVVNKPFGVAVHGGSGISAGVIEALRANRPDAKFLELVHRLDKDTSGCLMIAKKRAMLKDLHQRLRDEKGVSIEKHYTALVCGRWNGKEHRVTAALEKFNLPNGERMVRVAREGKPSLTIFKPQEHFDGCSLVKALPITGRTHQIRVHGQYAGHPLAGDPKYTDKERNNTFKKVGLNRLFLHADTLIIPNLLEKGKDFVVKAPLDDKLTSVLQQLRESS